jgi:hypothetical protein
LESRLSLRILRKWVALMSLTNVCLAVAAVLGGAVVLVPTRRALSDAGAPEEFAGSMFAGAGGLLLVGVGILLGVTSLCGLWLYRRSYSGARIRVIDWLLLLVVSLPPVSVIAWLCIRTAQRL